MKIINRKFNTRLGPINSIAAHEAGHLVFIRCGLDGSFPKEILVQKEGLSGYVIGPGRLEHLYLADDSSALEVEYVRKQIKFHTRYNVSGLVCEFLYNHGYQINRNEALRVSFAGFLNSSYYIQRVRADTNHDLYKFELSLKLSDEANYSQNKLSIWNEVFHWAQIPSVKAAVAYAADQVAYFGKLSWCDEDAYPIDSLVLEIDNILGKYKSWHEVLAYKNECEFQLLQIDVEDNLLF